jgi:pimeloyl-ACP methyl ester carboxylesterase
MINPARLIYLHGLESSSQSGKARDFAKLFPGMVTPDFTGSLDERMTQLLPLLDDKVDWTIIGSSFGGLMGAIFTLDHPDQVRKLVLLAPALFLPPLGDAYQGDPVSVPTILIHGDLDEVVPMQPVRIIAENFFTNLSFIDVNDDHRLHKTMQALDWLSILE